MKRIISLFIVFMMIFSLVSCSKNDKKDKPEDLPDNTSDTMQNEKKPEPEFDDLQVMHFTDKKIPEYASQIDFDAEYFVGIFNISEMYAVRYGDVYLISFKYTSDVPMTCSFFNPPNGDVFVDILYLPQSEEESVASLYIPASEIERADCMTIKAIATELYGKTDNADLVFVEDFWSQVKDIASREADFDILDVQYANVRSVSDDTVSSITAVRNGENIDFTMKYDLSSESRVSVFNPPDGNILSIFDESVVLSDEGEYKFSVSQEDISNLDEITIQIIGNTYSNAFINPAQLARLK